jgi:hypothetical protein
LKFSDAAALEKSKGGLLDEIPGFLNDKMRLREYTANAAKGREPILRMMATGGACEAFRQNQTRRGGRDHRNARDAGPRPQERGQIQDLMPEHSVKFCEHTEQEKTDRGRLRIQDEFTALNLSRRRKHQLRRVKAGLCVKCNNPHAEGYELCAQHLISIALQSQKNGTPRGYPLANGSGWRKRKAWMLEKAKSSKR